MLSQKRQRLVRPSGLGTGVARVERRADGAPGEDEDDEKHQRREDRPDDLTRAAAASGVFGDGAGSTARQHRAEHGELSDRARRDADPEEQLGKSKGRRQEHETR